MYSYYTQLEYSTRFVSGPSVEPVTIDEIRKALVIDEGSAFDPTDLVSKAKAARVEAEGILGKKIGAQVWDLVINWWPTNWLLPLEPVQSIAGIYWIDWDGVEHSVDASIYAYAPQLNRLWLRPGYFWPDSQLFEWGAIRIRVNVGIPLNKLGENVKQAILLRTGTFSNIREDMTLGTVQQAGKVGTFEALLGVERASVGI